MQVGALIDAALGVTRADRLLRNGRIVNVYSGEVLPGDVAIQGDRIVGVGEIDPALVGPDTEEIDLGGQYVVPGLFDPHFHVGGSHLTMTELARALVPLGTTTIATDQQEAYTYAGPKAVRLFLDEASGSGLRIFLVPSVHVLGLEDEGTFNWAVSGDDMVEMLQWDDCIGINEPPPRPVLGKHPGVMQAIQETRRLRKTFVGHAPAIHGSRLQAYVAAGGSSDHESTAADQALEKLRLGMRTMMREGSASPDLAALVELAVKYPASTRFMMLCSDEEDPSDLMSVGHMDDKIRKVVKAGVPAVTAIQMASLNCAEYFKLDDRLGSVTPGKLADLVVSKDLDDFRASMVFAGGELTARDGKMLRSQAKVEHPEFLRSRVNTARPFQASDFRVAAPIQSGELGIRVIRVRDSTLVSEAVERMVAVDGGEIRPDLGQDVLKLAVIERHKATGNVGRAFVTGFGFTRGAVATTYCHVHYNLLGVGSSDEDIAAATNAVRDMGGGMAVVRDGEVLARWALPIVGIFSLETLEGARDSFVAMNEAIRSIGCPFRAPVLALSFVALSTIPAYGVTDLGLYDVAAQKFVDLVVAQ